MKQKIVSVMLSAVVIINAMSIPPLRIQAMETVTNQADEQYVIMYDEEADVGNYVDETSTLEAVSGDEIKEAGILFVELSKDEAQELEEQGVIVEEDCVFDAMTVDKIDVNVTISDEQQESDGEDIEKFEQKDAVYEWNIGAVRGENYINVPSADNQVKIALLDSGVDYRPELNVQEYVSTLYEDELEMGAMILRDSSGHGTAIASLINGVPSSEGIKGMNKDALLYSVQVLDENNKGKLSGIVQGIYWAIENDMDIINMSFGTTVNSEILHQAICDAADAGILMVAAAGNTPGQINYPAAYDEVIAVGASTMDGNISDYSACGEMVDIYAPGENVLADSPLFGTQVVNGTSIACAIVSAGASVVWETDRSKDASDIRSLILETSNEQIDTVACRGILDIETAIESMESYDLMDSGEQEDTSKPVPVYDELEVKALWHNTGHQSMIPSTDVARGYRIMYAASIYPDIEGGEFKKQRRYHGTRNYWEILQFMTNLAHAYYVGDVAQQRRIYNRADESDIGKAENYEDITNDDSAAEAMKNYLGRTALNLNNTDGSPLDEKDNHNMAYKIMGIAIHTIGDTYAHRTVVTENMISRNVEAFSDDRDPSYFIKSEFVKWSTFYKDVQDNKVDFRDIKKYLKVINKERPDYEDEPKLVNARYQNAKETVRRLVENGSAWDFRATDYVWTSATMRNRSMLRPYTKTEFNIK